MTPAACETYADPPYVQPDLHRSLDFPSPVLTAKATYASRDTSDKSDRLIAGRVTKLSRRPAARSHPARPRRRVALGSANRWRVSWVECGLHGRSGLSPRGPRGAGHDRPRRTRMDRPST